MNGAKFGCREEIIMQRNIALVGIVKSEKENERFDAGDYFLKLDVQKVFNKLSSAML